VLLLGLTLYGVFNHQGVAYFLWAYVAMYAFDCIFFWVLLHVLKIARIRWRFETPLLKQWFWMGLPFAVTYVLTTLYWKVDVPILKLFRTSAEVGWYSLAYKPFEALLFVPMTMLGVVLPVLAVYQRTSQDRLRAAVAMFFKALLMLGWPLSLGVVVLAYPLAGLWAPFYRESIPAIQILARVRVRIRLRQQRFHRRPHCSRPPGFIRQGCRRQPGCQPGPQPDPHPAVRLHRGRLDDGSH